MTKLHSLGLLIVTAFSLAGCELYFGENRDDRGPSSYCGPDGYYVCDDDNCSWAGAECPVGVPGGGNNCASNQECAAGCYCDENGVCAEAGYCTDDKDCGNGYVCNKPRSSCEPPAPPAPTCGGEPTAECATPKPTCALGDVPTLVDGCYTGQCQALAACTEPPTCKHINTEAQCTAAGCDAVLRGINCSDPNGGTCTGPNPAPTCQCERYDLVSCDPLGT